MDYGELITILTKDSPSVTLREREDEVFALIPELLRCKGFDQNNEWHIYDVWEHILHVIDGVPADPELRVAALFHDAGKPEVYTEDSDGVGHFLGHWEASAQIFDSYSAKMAPAPLSKKRISNLILYHDINLLRADHASIERFLSVMCADDIERLLVFKHSDIMAQNPKFHEKGLSSLAQFKEILSSKGN